MEDFLKKSSLQTSSDTKNSRLAADLYDIEQFPTSGLVFDAVTGVPSYYRQERYNELLAIVDATRIGEISDDDVLKEIHWKAWDQSRSTPTESHGRQQENNIVIVPDHEPHHVNIFDEIDSSAVKRTATKQTFIPSENQQMSTSLFSQTKNQFLDQETDQYGTSIVVCGSSPVEPAEFIYTVATDNEQLSATDIWRVDERKDIKSAQMTMATAAELNTTNADDAELAHETGTVEIVHGLVREPRYKRHIIEEVVVEGCEKFYEDQSTTFLRKKQRMRKSVSPRKETVTSVSSHNQQQNYRPSSTTGYDGSDSSYVSRYVVVKNQVPTSDNSVSRKNDLDSADFATPTKIALTPRPQLDAAVCDYSPTVNVVMHHDFTRSGEGKSEKNQKGRKPALSYSVTKKNTVMSVPEKITYITHHDNLRRLSPNTGSTDTVFNDTEQRSVPRKHRNTRLPFRVSQSITYVTRYKVTPSKYHRAKAPLSSRQHNPDEDSREPMSLQTHEGINVQDLVEGPHIFGQVHASPLPVKDPFAHVGDYETSNNETISSPFLITDIRKPADHHDINSLYLENVTITSVEERSRVHQAAGDLRLPPASTVQDIVTYVVEYEVNRKKRSKRPQSTTAVEAVNPAHVPDIEATSDGPSIRLQSSVVPRIGDRIKSSSKPIQESITYVVDYEIQRKKRRKVKTERSAVGEVSTRIALSNDRHAAQPGTSFALLEASSPAKNTESVKYVVEYGITRKARGKREVFVSLPERKPSMPKPFIHSSNVEPRNDGLKDRRAFNFEAQETEKKTTYYTPVDQAVTPFEFETVPTVPELSSPVYIEPKKVIDKVMYTTEYNISRRNGKQLKTLKAVPKTENEGLKVVPASSGKLAMTSSPITLEVTAADSSSVCHAAVAVPDRITYVVDYEITSKIQGKTNTSKARDPNSTKQLTEPSNVAMPTPESITYQVEYEITRKNRRKKKTNGIMTRENVGELRIMKVNVADDQVVGVEQLAERTEVVQVQSGHNQDPGSVKYVVEYEIQPKKNRKVTSQLKPSVIDAFESTQFEPHMFATLPIREIEPEAFIEKRQMQTPQFVGNAIAETEIQQEIIEIPASCTAMNDKTYSVEFSVSQMKQQKSSDQSDKYAASSSACLKTESSDHNIKKTMVPVEVIVDDNLSVAADNFNFTWEKRVDDPRVTTDHTLQHAVVDGVDGSQVIVRYDVEYEVASKRRSRRFESPAKIIANNIRAQTPTGTHDTTVNLKRRSYNDTDLDTSSIQVEVEKRTASSADKQGKLEESVTYVVEYATMTRKRGKDNTLQSGHDFCSSANDKNNLEVAESLNAQQSGCIDVINETSGIEKTTEIASQEMITYIVNYEISRKGLKVKTGQLEKTLNSEVELSSIPIAQPSSGKLKITGVAPITELQDEAEAAELKRSQPLASELENTVAVINASKSMTYVVDYEINMRKKKEKRVPEDPSTSVNSVADAQVSGLGTGQALVEVRELTSTEGVFQLCSNLEPSGSGTPEEPFSQATWPASEMITDVVEYAIHLQRKSCEEKRNPVEPQALQEQPKVESKIAQLTNYVTYVVELAVKHPESNQVSHDIVVESGVSSDGNESVELQPSIVLHVAKPPPEFADPNFVAENEILSNDAKLMKLNTSFRTYATVPEVEIEEPLFTHDILHETTTQDCCFESITTIVDHDETYPELINFSEVSQGGEVTILCEALSSTVQVPEQPSLYLQLLKIAAENGSTRGVSSTVDKQPVDIEYRVNNSLRSLNDSDAVGFIDGPHEYTYNKFELPTITEEVSGDLVVERQNSLELDVIQCESVKPVEYAREEIQEIQCTQVDDAYVGAPDLDVDAAHSQPVKGVEQVACKRKGVRKVFSKVLRKRAKKKKQQQPQVEDVKEIVTYIVHYDLSKVIESVQDKTITSTSKIHGQEQFEIEEAGFSAPDVFENNDKSEPSPKKDDKIIKENDEIINISSKMETSRSDQWHPAQLEVIVTDAQIESLPNSEPDFLSDIPTMTPEVSSELMHKPMISHEVVTLPNENANNSTNLKTSLGLPPIGLVHLDKIGVPDKQGADKDHLDTDLMPEFVPTFQAKSPNDESVTFVVQYEISPVLMSKKKTPHDDTVSTNNSQQTNAVVDSDESCKQVQTLSSGDDHVQEAVGADRRRDVTARSPTAYGVRLFKKRKSAKRVSTENENVKSTLGVTPLASETDESSTSIRTVTSNEDDRIYSGMSTPTSGYSERVTYIVDYDWTTTSGSSVGSERARQDMQISPTSTIRTNSPDSTTSQTTLSIRMSAPTEIGTAEWQDSGIEASMLTSNEDEFDTLTRSNVKAHAVANTAEGRTESEKVIEQNNETSSYVPFQNRKTTSAKFHWNLFGVSERRKHAVDAGDEVPSAIGREGDQILVDECIYMHALPVTSEHNVNSNRVLLKPIESDDNNTGEGYRVNTQNSDSVGAVVDRKPIPFSDGHLVVVAIDFGTTFSGYAFSFTSFDGVGKPLAEDNEGPTPLVPVVDRIHVMRRWEGGDPGVVNHKAPTTLLLNEDGDFHSFGFTARDFYHDLSPKQAMKWMFFDKFKMMLHNDSELSVDSELTASNGEGVSALVVFSFVLAFFRNHALQEISDQSGTRIFSDDVKWVITVPAIWRESAKEFMRTAAYRAGIGSVDNPEQLVIALEPEAASIYVRRLHLHQLIPESPLLERPRFPRQRASVSPEGLLLGQCHHVYGPMAGIGSVDNPEQLVIALEPEAASIYVRRLHLHQLIPESPLLERPKFPRQRASVSPEGIRIAVKHTSQESLGSLTGQSSTSVRYSRRCFNNTYYSELTVADQTDAPGTRYMIVDCGGGTVDITVHELKPYSNLPGELHKTSSGGPFGSMGVDMAFEELLVDIFGADFLSAFKTKRPAGWIDLMMAFESRKRAATPIKTKALNVSLPFSFIDFHKKFRNCPLEVAVRNYGSRDVLWSSQGMLRLMPGAIRRLFRPTLDGIKLEVANALNNPAAKGVKFMFLVGGFSESPMLQLEVRNEFKHLVKVIIPIEVSLAILKGAVCFGIESTNPVGVRFSCAAYSLSVARRFVAGVDPVDKLIRCADDTEWCAEVLDTFVDVGQPVRIGESVLRRYNPTTPIISHVDGLPTVAQIVVCRSDCANVRYSTDRGVERCGSLVLTLDETCQTTEIRVRMTFGETEIKVTALDYKSGRTVSAGIEFSSRSAVQDGAGL